MTTHFLQDILRQPVELERVIRYLSGAGRQTLEKAAAAVRGARHVYLTGIGASWHAALNAGALFHLGGRPVYLQDAAELLHFAEIPPDAVFVVLSRSGRSVEIVRLLAKARESGATVVGVTNAPDGPLAKESQIPIVAPAALDHGISVGTYSTLALAAGALASATLGSFDNRLVDSLSGAVAETVRLNGIWQGQIADSVWLAPGASHYFLARGSSLGSCHEARLLWEEGAKSPATSVGTGAFRHGSQEMVMEGSRFGMWINATEMREEDLAVARDLRRLGASVMLIGQNLPEDAGDLVLQLPGTPPRWQFLVDIVPAQLAAERMSRLSGVDCDTFRVCSYVVEGEHGLLPAAEGIPKDGK
jgi:glucosamine--fructose-6-phosphate aminotransferase (isomerizing)